jgi:AmiR/NasT family two-component response regulator
MPAPVDPLYLVLSTDADLSQRVARGLIEHGTHAAAVATVEAAMDQIGATHNNRARQHMVVVDAAEPAQRALDALFGAWQDRAPAPVSLIGAVPADAPRWVAAGLSGVWPAALAQQPAELAAALRLDAVRWRHDAAQREQLRRLREQLDDRIVVERAKGVLMRSRGITEDSAFGLLRDGSMHANLRVGEVSKSVVEAAQWAEAINRSGQLRMLSQRVIKLAAQRHAGIERRRAAALLEQQTRHVQDNLEHLATSALTAAAPQGLRDALKATRSAWDALRAQLAQPQTLASLLAADLLADTLLARADELTLALESTAGRRAMRIVNLCGRQRMRVQRLAKTALLRSLKGLPSDGAALAAQLEEFEAALLELERTPLSSQDIRQLLGSARDQWMRLVRGLRDTDGELSRTTLTQASEALLETFDRLTEAYAHSLQVIMS